MIEIVAEKDYPRLDTFLAAELNVSRTSIQKHIKNNCITCEDNPELKPATPVLEGQKFLADLPESPNISKLEAQPVDFGVAYEDEHIIIINKPPRLVVHPAPGNWNGTLVNGLVYRYPEFRKMSNWMRPGIVHRLDSGTSGLMVVGRYDDVCRVLQRMFARRVIRKTYLAMAHGKPEKREGILSGPMDRDPVNFMRMAIVENGKHALTGYRVLWSMNGYSLIECRLFTGRMHQIRVHMSALGCPLSGDTMYGADMFGDVFDGRIYLHSWKLGFEHPVTHESLEFRQKLPDDFLRKIDAIITKNP